MNADLIVSLDHGDAVLKLLPVELCFATSACHEASGRDRATFRVSPCESTRGSGSMPRCSETGPRLAEVADRLGPLRSKCARRKAKETRCADVADDDNCPQAGRDRRFYGDSRPRCRAGARASYYVRPSLRVFVRVRLCPCPMYRVIVQVHARSLSCARVHARLLCVPVPQARANGNSARPRPRLSPEGRDEGTGGRKKATERDGVKPRELVSPGVRYPDRGGCRE